MAGEIEFVRDEIVSATGVGAVRRVDQSKQTYICVKRDLRMCQNRPTYVSNETYICAVM